jgi:BASS family bile acid:Na+ symporter
MNLLKNKSNLIVLVIFLGFILDVLSFFSKQLLSLIVNISFFLLIFLTFLKIDFKKLVKIKKFLRPLFILILLDYILFPFLIFFALKTGLISLNSGISLLFLILAPSAISSIYLVSLVKGDKEESLVIVLFTHILFIFILPLIVLLYSHFLNNFNLDFAKFIKILIFYLIIPILISFLIQKVKLHRFIIKNKFFDNLSFFLLLLIIF